MAKVLVVDDAEEIVRLLTCQLQGQGYDVSVAFSGTEALEAASAEPPDAVLLDVMMPDMDGIEYG
jgi:CheY-like chemotaxis protein